MQTYMYTHMHRLAEWIASLLAVATLVRTVSRSLCLSRMPPSCGTCFASSLRYVHVCMCVCMRVYVNMYVRMLACVYVCIHVYTHI